jgi:predicted Na+-dependent transporter
MHRLDTLTLALNAAFLMMAMFSVGLKTAPADLRAFTRSTDIFLRILIANFLAVPIIGLVIIKRLQLEPEMAAACALLAFTPGGLGALLFTSRFKGQESLAGAIAVFLSTAAIFFSPAMLHWVVPETYPIRLPYDRAAAFVLLALFMPLGAGMLIRQRLAAWSGRVAAWTGILSSILFAAMVLLIYSDHQDLAHAVALAHLLPMLLLTLVALVVGWLFGGPALESRAVVAMSTSMRHISLSLLIALHTFNNDKVETNLVAFTLLMLAVNAAFMVAFRIYLRATSR